MESYVRYIKKLRSFLLSFGIGSGGLHFPSLDKHLQGISTEELETFASFFHVHKPYLLFKDYKIAGKGMSCIFK